MSEVEIGKFGFGRKKVQGTKHQEFGPNPN